MPYGIRATLATPHEVARRGMKYWVSELGSVDKPHVYKFIGLSTSRKMVSFFSPFTHFSLFEKAWFFPDAHARLSFADKLSAQRCLEEIFLAIAKAQAPMTARPLSVDPGI